LNPHPVALASGESAARKRMDAFLSGPIFDYARHRDLPGIHGTSRLSQDLRYGLLSIRELYARCEKLSLEADPESRRGVATYVNELIWREFYFQVLWHWPDVLNHEFQEKFRALKWHHSEQALGGWCRGETGFPIVDAGMRELAATGFMHNRVRMITAMFLVKDLHLSWKQGEQWFMRQLLDGEIASNNGGWQWSAGTGTDAAPYFRIQNPWSQTAKFDPEGAYIQKWVPELRSTDPARFAQPPAPGLSVAKGYPPPIVDHARERDVTLDLYRM
jgi:deoxyribodipyrimidine photo-lyase